MDVHQMQYVLAVAQCRSFTIAAENCYVSQSTLSQQISNLERELGVSLFKRTTRNIQVTEAGEAFIRMATQILRDMDLLKQTMAGYAGFVRGTISIGAITALEQIGFSDMIADFYATYPNLTLHIDRGPSLALLESLEKKVVDVAFLTLPPDVDKNGLNFKLLGEDEYALVIPEKHPLAGRESVELSELKDERFILHNPEQAVSRLCIQACMDAGFVPNVTCRIESSEIILNLVRTGLGVAFLPAEELEHFRMDGVHRLRLVDPIKKQIVMTTRVKGMPSHLVDVFVRFVEEWMHQRNP